jgi:hypothetical protein
MMGNGEDAESSEDSGLTAPSCGGPRELPLLSVSLSSGTMSDKSSDRSRLAFRWAHGGIGTGSTHKPFLASRVSFSYYPGLISHGELFGASAIHAAYS